MTAGRITVLVENSTGGRGLLAEHGLSIWIEYGSRRVLFDTGQSDVLFHNAQVLGIDLSATDQHFLRLLRLATVRWHSAGGNGCRRTRGAS